MMLTTEDSTTLKEIRDSLMQLRDQFILFNDLFKTYLECRYNLRVDK